jgi:cytoskeleton protein RodZ
VKQGQLQQVDAFATPGCLLRAARRARGMDEAEVADHLNWLPGYVAMIEADDYQSLRRPAFARGYVRAYGKFLGLDEAELLNAFDQQDVERSQVRKRVTSRPPQLHSTRAGVVIGLLVLLLLVLALWWWRGDVGGRVSMAADWPAGAAGESHPGDVTGGADR